MDMDLHLERIELVGWLGALKNTILTKSGGMEWM